MRDDAPREDGRLPLVVRRLLGPAAIVSGVLLVLHRHVFGGMADSLAGDPLGFFLPNHCFLGKALAEGNIPLWNPHVMGGIPFAADPQSGWMSFQAMLLYALLPCSAAFGWYIAIHPILAGLGVLLFLRAEGRSRAAATLGGLALALPLAGSSIASESFPLSAALAWTSLTLAAASKYRRSETWGSGLLWLTALSISWGQLAAAHMSTGLVLGSLLLAVYLVSGLVSDVRRRGVPGQAAMAKVGLLLIALPAINAAILLPRILYLPRTTLAVGYQGLTELTRSISELDVPGGTFGRGLRASWLLTLGRAPGYYLGGALVLAAVAWIDRPIRRIALPFVAFGLFCFVASLQPTAQLLRPLRDSALGTLYLHAPGRFLYGVLVAVAVLAGLGLDAWTRRRWRPGRVALLMLAVAVWASLPLTHWRDAFQVASSLGTALLAPILLLAATRAGLGWTVPGTLAMVLLLGGLWGHTTFLRPDAERSRTGRPPSEPPLHARSTLATFLRPRPPDVRVDAFVDPGPIAGYLASQRDGRFISVNPERTFPSGYLAQRKGWWGLLASQQAMVFGLEEAQGYDPIQLPRYWTFLRTVDPKPIQYGRGWFLAPSAVAFDVLEIEWVIGSGRPDLPVALVDTGAGQGVWRLYRTADLVPRVSIATDWSVVLSPQEALERVTDPSFASGQIVVEEDPGITEATSPRAGWARFRWVGTDAARVDVYAAAPAIVLVRNAWELNWRAHLDGREVPVLAANYLVQGIPVPQGRHSIHLEYGDRSVGLGLAISGVSVGAVLSLGIALRARTRKQRTA